MRRRASAKTTPPASTASERGRCYLQLPSELEVGGTTRVLRAPPVSRSGTRTPARSPNEPPARVRCGPNSRSRETRFLPSRGCARGFARSGEGWRAKCPPLGKLGRLHPPMRCFGRRCAVADVLALEAAMPQTEGGRALAHRA